MISRKDWNNLKPSTRLKIVKIIYWNMPEDFQQEMAEEWHHNIDIKHKAIFDSLYWITPGKEIKVVTTFNV